MRKSLELNTGDQFAVIGKGDSVIVKTISPPSLDEFDDLLNEARRQAQKTGMKKTDIQKAIDKVRRQK